jgi:hypothetical protein
MPVRDCQVKVSVAEEDVKSAIAGRQSETESPTSPINRQRGSWPPSR